MIDLAVVAPLSSHPDHHLCSLQSREDPSSRFMAHHGLMGRHNDPAPGRGDALLSSPLLLRCRSWRPDTAAPRARVATGDAPPPLRQRTPEEGVGRPVVLACVAQQASAGGWQADGVDEVFQDAVLHVGEGAVAKRLLEEQTHQRGFEALVPKLPQGLQDAGDAQVVVLGPT